MTELFLVNGKLNTQDPAYPTASAAAIRDGRFIAVGSDDEIRSLAQASARVINLEGRRVLPGLADSHVHFYDWALSQRQLKLENVHSLANLVEQLSQFASKTPPRCWITGYGWNATGWPEDRQPNRQDLDKVAPNNPVILWQSSLHLAVANSLALQAAGITAETSDPPQGIIDREVSGEPTGVLRDLAINLVSTVMPPPNEAETMAAFKDGFVAFHKLGLTSVHDQRLMGAPEGAAAFRIWQLLHDVNEIRLRVWMNLLGDRLDEIIILGLRTGFGDNYFRIGHLKYFADGAQGPRTAWMLEPYEGTDITGLPLTPIQDLAIAVRRAHASGLAVAIHSIGDRTNRELITVFEDLYAHGTVQVTAPPLAPHRIEHLQIIRPEDIARLAKLPVVASVQPIQVIDDMEMMEPTIGARSRYAYNFRSMWDAGIPLVFNSDCPVCNPNPMWGIHAAVTRRRRDGTPPGGWYPEQCLTVDQAVHGFTMGAAIVSGRQTDLGSITPGKLADLVVLDRDIFSIDPMEIFDTKPVMTVFDGQIVYEV
jgi:predicted amidohydrolase YtcJ